MQQQEEEGEYIVMLPFMAHGHLTPFLALANSILRSSSSSRNLTIIIAATKLNLRYLHSSSPNLLFAELQQPSCSSDNANTENVPRSQMAAFLLSSLALESPARSLLRSLASTRSGRTPLCLVFDVFLGWAARLAAETSSVAVAFSTGGAYATAAYMSLWVNLPHRRCGSGSDDDSYFVVPGFPERCRFSLSQLHPYLRKADGADDWSTFFQKVIGDSVEGSHAWLCCTVEEFEPLGMEIMRNYVGAPVFAIWRGALPLASKKEYGIPAEDCTKWLDSKPPRSVVYVSFGSQNTVGAKEMMALAEGLEMSQKAFIWVIRPPAGFDQREEMRAEWLPEGFEERIRERGMLVRNWAPQMDILRHKATGAFLSHCGWNSVMEALGEGVGLIGWSIAAEQAYNVKMLVEEKGVCVEMARGATCGIRAEEVRLAVDAVVGNVEMRRRVEVRDQLRAAVGEDGSAVRGIRDLVGFAVAKRGEMNERAAGE